MARLKKGKERLDTSGLRKVLDFEGTTDSCGLQVIDERSMEHKAGGSRRHKRILSLESGSEESKDSEVFHIYPLMTLVVNV